MTSLHPNMINEVMSAKKSLSTPFPGLAATMFCGSDRYAMVVTKVYTPKKIEVSHVYSENEFVTHNNGIQTMPEETLQKYIDNGITYTYRKNKRWMPAGSGLWETCSVHLGNAEEYRDPSF